MLSLIPPSKYTMIHGQCTSVGVGGYLLGGGVNFVGTTSKYGTGASNVLEYTLVTADGNIVIVNKDNVTQLDYYGKKSKVSKFLINTVENSITFKGNHDIEICKTKFDLSFSKLL